MKIKQAASPVSIQEAPPSAANVPAPEAVPVPKVVPAPVLNPNAPSPSVPLITRLLKTYVRPQMRGLAMIFLLMLVSAAMTGALAQLMQPTIDKIFTEKNESMLLPVALAVFFVFTARGLSTYGHSVLLNRLGLRVVADIQRDMFGHLVYADVHFIHGQSSGQLLSRFLSDVNLIRTALTDTLTGIGKSALSVIFLVGVMFYQDWKLSLISLFVFPVAGYAIARLGKKLRKISSTTQGRIGDMTAMLNQALQGCKHVKSYGQEEFERARVNGLIEGVFKLLHKAFRVSAVLTPIGEMLNGVAIVTIITYGGMQVIHGESTAGRLFSFIAAFLLAFEPIKRITRMSNTMQMGLASLDRTFKMLDVKPRIADKPDAPALKLRSPVISFRDVRFSYNDISEALRGVTFTAPAGKTVALVGESGAGKSTILNLIPRFYDVTSGSIEVDGQDLRDVTQKSLRDHMALVSQEVAIFSDTVRENIAYGTPGASDEQIFTAARMAAAHDFILDLPQGYNTLVGENGLKLSGGQRQRISIARAFLRNAPILLLDEATSALDATSERLVQAALRQLQKGRTTVVVAHRLSTIIEADIIFVMSQGQVVESGNHDQLLARDGMYTRLYGKMLKEIA
jgi:subfamily B ATP-binding cassette protein MsbA